jgi:hypothetical protein
MGVRLPSAGNQVLQNALPANNTEVIVLTSQPINISLDFQQVLIFWYISIQAGTSTASIGVKLRRGATTAGLLLNGANAGITLAAGQAQNLTGCWIDTPGAVAGIQYSIGLVQTGATGAGTMLDQSILVMAL